MADIQSPSENVQDTHTTADAQKEGSLQEKEVSSSDEDVDNVQSPPSPLLAGRRLGGLTFGLCLCVFLSALDMTIVSTSVTAISNDLNAFDQSSWIVSSYLTTYFSFLIIWAKLSDFLGRKLMLSGAIVFFLAFSAACGGAKTPIQLIVCRAFQGVGGAGIFSMVPIIVVEMVEPQKYGAYNGFVSIAIALSFLLGPLLGGAITDGTTWRWIFWINLPVGAIALALILITMPAGFPEPTTMASTKLFGVFKKDFNIRNRVDYPGFFMLLTTCVLLVVAIEEAGTDYAWNSALAIACLVLAGVIFIAFITWQWYMDYSKSPREPVFPWQFVKNRVLMGMYLQAFLSGIPFVTFVIELPLRFISINGKSAFDSGVGVLPFTLGIGVSSGVAGMFLAKGRVPVIPQVLFASILQILGTGLLYSVPVTTHIPARIYGYQVLVGMGAGFSLTSLIMTVPAIVDRRVLAVGMGGVTQMRILGGALGTSIATNILNTTAKSRLATEISAETLSRILKDVSLVKTLSSADQLLVQAAFGAGFRRQLAMMLGFCAAELIAVAMMMEWPLRRLQ